MENEFKLTPMEIKNGHYIINRKKRFTNDIALTESMKKQVLRFAYDITFGKKGQHRDHRAEGKIHRNDFQIFFDVFQGKSAEVAFYFFCTELWGMPEESVSKPDFSVSPLGIWDSADFTINGKYISLKSTKDYSNLLLLETSDYDANGDYIPDRDKDCKHIDYFFFTRVTSVDRIVKLDECMENGKISFLKIWKLICDNPIYVNLAGFMTKNDFKKVIHERQIIYAGNHLGAKTRMDVNNYYVQAGDLRRIKFPNDNQIRV